MSTTFFLQRRIAESIAALQAETPPAIPAGLQYVADYVFDYRASAWEYVGGERETWPRVALWIDSRTLGAGNRNSAEASVRVVCEAQPDLANSTLAATLEGCEAVLRRIIQRATSEGGDNTVANTAPLTMRHKVVAKAERVAQVELTTTLAYDAGENCEPITFTNPPTDCEPDLQA